MTEKHEPVVYLIDLFDRLRKAGPGAKVKRVIGRRGDYLIVVDKDGRRVEWSEINAQAFRNLEAAAREVDAFLDPKDLGPPFKFDGKRISAEAELALLSMHDYLNDVAAAKSRDEVVR